MTATMPRARANTALAAGVPGTRVGYQPTPAPEPHYFPSKGAWFANRQILRRPKTIVRARQIAAEWLATADPRTAPAFTFMADYWAALDAHIGPRGEMALYLRHNH
jgi:hypothetical protein